MPDPYQILLQTKLHRPQTPRGLIDRPQLLKQLDSGIHRPLTLVLASAGFGKTTLVSSWLEHRMAADQDAKTGMPSAWLSLDENDSDLTVFFRYFIAALRTIFNGCLRGDPGVASGEAAAAAVGALRHIQQRDRAAARRSFILVLDDYHAIHGMDVHDLLNEMTRHWPKPLHLVLDFTHQPVHTAGQFTREGHAERDSHP